MASWGNQQNQQYLQNMESPPVTEQDPGYYLHVTKNSTDSTIQANNTFIDAFALEVNGRANIEFDGYATACHVKQPNVNNPIELALHVEGLVRIEEDVPAGIDLVKISNNTLSGGGLNCQCPVTIDRSIKFTNANSNDFIDSADNQSLFLNTNSPSSHIQLGRSDGGADTLVNGTLRATNLVPRTGGFLNLGNVAGLDINIGNSGMAGHFTKVNNNLLCNNGLDPFSAAYVLPLGAHSDGVDLAATTKNTHVLGTLEVAEATALSGAVDLNNTLDQDVNTTGAALDVTNANTGGTAIAIKATGPIALDAEGHIALASGKRLILDSPTGDNYIVFSSTNTRIEFIVGGTLHFYIDDHGGHSV